MTMMIERVARTLCRRSGRDPDARMTERDAVILDEVDAPFWTAYTETARAVRRGRNDSPAYVDQAGSLELKPGRIRY
jgi:hypothetical protein